MRFNKHLSTITNQSIFIHTDGSIYLQFKSSMIKIGTTASEIHQLLDNIDLHI